MKTSKQEQLFFALTPMTFLLLVVGLTSVIMGYLNISATDNPVGVLEYSAIEYFWRIFWASLLVIIVLYSLVMCWHAIKIISNNLGPMPEDIRREVYWAMVGLILLIVAFLTITNSTFSAVALFIESSNNDCMENAVKIQLGISTATVFLVGFSSCSLLYSKEYININTIKQKNREFKRSFYLTSGYLGIGVVQFFSLFTWASHASNVIDSPKTLIYAITIGSSILYTLVFVVMFVPVSIRIRLWIEDIAKKNNIDVYNLERLNEFKKLNGLYDSPRNNLKQIMLLLSPALIGVLSGIVSKLATS